MGWPGGETEQLCYWISAEQPSGGFGRTRRLRERVLTVDPEEQAARGDRRALFLAEGAPCLGHGRAVQVGRHEGDGGSMWKAGREADSPTTEGEVGWEPPPGWGLMLGKGDPMNGRGRNHLPAPGARGSP